MAPPSYSYKATPVNLSKTRLVSPSSTTSSVKSIFETRLGNLFSDINNFLAYKEGNLEQIAAARRDLLIARANRLIQKLDTYGEDDDIVDQLDNETLEKIRTNRTRLEIRANKLALLIEKTEIVKKEENPVTANQTIAPNEDLPKFYGDPCTFPVFLIAIHDLVLSDATLDTRAKYRKVFFSLGPQDQMMLAQLIDPSEPDLTTMLQVLILRYQEWLKRAGFIHENAPVGGDINYKTKGKEAPEK